MHCYTSSISLTNHLAPPLGQAPSQALKLGGGWSRYAALLELKSALRSWLNVLVPRYSEAHSLPLFPPIHVTIPFYRILDFTQSILPLVFCQPSFFKKVYLGKYTGYSRNETKRAWLNFLNLSGKLNWVYPEFYFWVYFPDWSISSAERQTNLLMDQ